MSRPTDNSKQQPGRPPEESEAEVRKRAAELAADNAALRAELSALRAGEAARREIEQQLRASRLRESGIISSAMDAIITVDDAQRVTLFNAAAEKMFGVAAAEALGQPLDRFIPDRFRAAHRGHVRAFGQTNTSRRRMGALGRVFGLRAGGEEFPVEASISKIEVDGRQFFTVILRDVTEQQRAEERLREQAALLDYARDAIIVRDLDHRVLFWNRSAERLYGWSAAEAVGRSVKELIYRKNDAAFAEAARAALAAGEWVGELRQHDRDGRELVVESRWALVRGGDGRPKSVLVINTDVTERKKLEAQFLRAQRLESIGTLASGIAHDLNNILSPILTGLQLLQLKSADAESQRWLSMLLANAERGGELVQQILSFARGFGGERIQLQPKHLVKEVVRMMRETLPKSIEVKADVPNDLVCILGDATQLHQVLMNLCINARDAMPRGGALKVEAANVFLDESYSRLQMDIKPGRYLCLTVSDTGVGIPPEIINRIFDPFFTTKPHGQGTGLGLATVQGIIKSHGGFINLYSEVGRGTEFKIYLPEAANAETAAAAARPDLPYGRGEWVLVVDDEMTIREITKGMLENFGYRVVTAADGVEAVAKFAEHRDDIRLVLTDMMMPLMDGPATIRALRKLNPQVRIIASSGLAAESKMAEAEAAGVKTFLPKPYTADKLLKAVAEMLKS
jgi:two-component system, cell cycle sensor histidine kinase and response regulator CckA